MKHSFVMRAAFVAAMLLLSARASAVQDRPVPYWASISAGDALMRTGPGREYPAIWRYRRSDLPIKILKIHESWRRIREPDGTEGWMTAVLLSAQRTAIVVGEARPMRAAPDSNARVLWRVESGVVGRISHCAGGWCEFDTHGKVGYIETEGLWGVDRDETVR